MGDKYIIEIEKTPYRNSRGRLIWDATAFNTLHFDQEGMSRLKPLADEITKAYMAGTRVAEVCAPDNGDMEMLLRALREAVDMSSHELCRVFGCFTYRGLITTCAPEEIIRKYRKALRLHQAAGGGGNVNNVKRCGSCEHLDYSTAYLSDPPQYKCEYFGCIVRTDDICKKDRGGNKGKEDGPEE